MILEKIATPVEISAERFTLRPVRKSDAGLFALYAGDKGVAEATQVFPILCRPARPRLSVPARCFGRGRGTMGHGWHAVGPARGAGGDLAEEDRPRQSEVAFWVAPAFWNHGIASEAVQALVAANPQRNCTMFAEAFQDNPGSAGC